MKRYIFNIALCGAVALGSISPIYAQQEPTFVKTANTPAFDTDFTTAAEKTVNSVVCIKSYVSRKSNPYYGNSNPFDLFDFFFGGGNNSNRQQQQQPKQQQKSEPVQSGLGSGVIISEDGYIVTNNHVVAGADKLEVLLNDNTSYDAKIIGTDEASDLALIKINASGLSPIIFGNSDDVKIGEWVLAVGNPFGFNSTVTAGIISAKARSLANGNSGGKAGVESYLQTDAALNPGNSGGALVNLKGELIGINAAIYSNTGSYTGFSFAIPTTIVKKVITDIRQYGSVQRAVLGVSVTTLDAKTVKEKKITGTNAGLLVMSVEDMSTAKEMGLQPDDVIVAINSVTVHTFPQLQEQLSQYRPGDSITVSFYRDNKLMKKTGTLRNGQGNTNITKKGDFTSLGCAFLKLSPDVKEHLGISYGVQVSGLTKGKFSENGIKDGFIILEINGEQVSTSDDVESIFDSLMKEENTDRVMFIRGIYPTGKKEYYAVDLNDE